MSDTWLSLLLTGLLFSVAATAAEGPAAPFAGRPVAQIIDEFREAGIPFAYSTGLVGDDLMVIDEPTGTDAVALVKSMLEPHGLTIQTLSGVHLVVRSSRLATEPAGGVPVGDFGGPGSSTTSLENITVSASRYEISRDIASSRYTLDQRSIQSMPDVGSDPIRIAQRLPGAAASGASARTHFRGGNSDEIGILLNGQWLFDPFHIRDYQNVFSAIDARAISGVEVYTGGFPVRYGDRMSGMVVMESMESEKPRHTEIGLSVFNTSFLTTGVEAGRRWLFSARRGNLDLVIDPKFGEPSYFDVFAEAAFDLGKDTTLSFNALYADDRVRVVLESDPGELEQIVSKTSNAQFWVQLKSRWSDTLTSTTVLSAMSYDNIRVGSANDLEKIVSSVRDDRQIDQYAIRQEWTWSPSDRHLVQWGLQGSYNDALYDYEGQAEYFGIQALFENQRQNISRTNRVSPRGGSFAFFVSDRWRWTKKTTVEWGLRWDDQTYTEISSDAQLSPRVNFLHALNSRTELRLTWGRYHQSQGIQELQIEDGITNFWQAQRSDHVIAGIRRLIGENYSLRVEAYYKDMSRVRPRFENLFDPLGIIPEFQADRVAIFSDSGESQGIEVSIDYHKGPMDWWASYTLSDATDRINGRNEARSWDQRHSFQGGATWSGQKWVISAAAGVHSGWPTTDLQLLETGTDVNGEPTYVAIPGARNALQHNTFASLDFRISRTFDVRRGTLMAFFEVSNALNRNNFCCRDWDVVDTGGGILEIEHSYDYWLPLLPAVGILWEF